jgi:UDP-N-acetylglucosamine:LPS N-acetylglucosamine transferase
MQASRPTILILTTHTGGGHLNLAQSLKDMLGTHYNTVIVDPQPGSVERWYASVSRHFTKLLEWQFSCTDNEIASLCLHGVLTLFSRRQFLSIIEDVQPQLIITTHALLSYVTARVNEHRRKRLPLVFQLTDLGRLHMTWFSEKQADAYLAPTSEIFTQAMEQGINTNRLHLTGRPVRRQFLEVSPGERSATLAALEFDPAVFTIFLQAGAKGSAGVDQTLESVLSTGIPLQIILAVGNNKGMASRYADIKRVRVLPFTEVIAPYMAASDVIAGKAGASFISEAFMLEKPFLVTVFIPGQETPNLGFIQQHNLGWVCPETAVQAELLIRIASNPGMIAEKMDSIRAYKAWNMQANQHICPIIDRLLSSKIDGHQESA